ncbi:MAG TPA: fibronectin type III domain-containing protein, partial [Dissulfurispiraceae bacterium]|nr:fibronectin type III domain-containing protein [Dissulfurispiraceae bacterium]
MRIFALLIAAVALVALTCLSCGRKSEPTLKAYVKPSPVREVRAVQREGGFALTWTYPESERSRIDGFRLERAQTEEADRGECVSFVEIGHVMAKQSHFADTDVRRGVSYCYRILVESKKGVMSDP